MIGGSYSMIKVGDKVKVKENLPKVMRELGFIREEIPPFCRRFVNTTQEVFSIWTSDDGTEYATVDLCCEIPTQCLEVL